MNNKMGWRPDKPDMRDHLYSVHHSLSASKPSSIDLTKWCPRVFDQGDLGSCHDENTEILTKNGWINIATLTLDDQVASVDPVSRKLIYENPTRVIKTYHDGVLYYGKHRDLDFAVTPDHKMLVKNWNTFENTMDENFQLIPMKDVGWYSGLMSSVKFDGYFSNTITIKGVNHKRKKNTGKMCYFQWMLG